MSAATPTSIKGFCCPQCGISARTKTVKRTPNGSVQRRRECLSCGHLFLTVESVVRPSRGDRLPTHPARRQTALESTNDFAAQHRERWEREHR